MELYICALLLGPHSTPQCYNTSHPDEVHVPFSMRIFIGYLKQPFLLCALSSNPLNRATPHPRGASRRDLRDTVQCGVRASNHPRRNQVEKIPDEVKRPSARQLGISTDSCSAP